MFQSFKSKYIIMKTVTRINVVGILLGAVLLLGINQQVNAQSNDIVIIVNSDNPVEEMTAGKAKLYYLRKVKKRWPEIEKNIKPVDQAGNSELKSFFLSKVLGMPEAEVNNYFTQRQFANAEKPPIKFSSEDEVIKYVSENMGAIGYVSKQSFSRANGKVKAVLTL